MNRNLKKLLNNEAWLFAVAMIVFAGVALVYQYYWMAIGLSVAALGILIFMLALAHTREKSIAAYIQTSVDVLSRSSAASAPYPMATVRLSDLELLWHNKQFLRSLGVSEAQIGEPLTKVFPGFDLGWLKSGRFEADNDLTVRDRRFRCLGFVPKETEGGGDLALLLWIDTTELLNTRDEYLRSRPVVSLILIDNYDELTNNLNDSTVSNLNADLNKRINEWAVGIGGLLRKLERNRFLFIFEAKDLFRITEDKFSLLDNVRQVTNPNGLNATLSFGVGKDGAGFQENYDYAALALEMALSRGGDQAVIKDRYDFSFYGGRAVETERRSKVKSRVMASSLSALISQSSRVFLMGHKNADADAIGAAAGVGALCRSLGKPFNIVIDLAASTAPKLLRVMQADRNYDGVFLNAQDAIIQADAKSLLIVVDTNRPDQVESKPLLESLNRVAVIDHHRRAADYISNAAVNLHEPFASSCCELVTELLTYAVNSKTILPCELTALMAGIVLDTKNFTVRVNSRTFEAAAYLRLQGVDPVKIKKLFQNDFETTVHRYHIIETAEAYRNAIAIAVCDGQVDRALAGQAADELLSIDGIETSFVLFLQGSTVFISARSISDVNVQVVLEPLGGGGNAATAGAQLRGCTMPEAKEKLMEAIDVYFKE